MEVLEIRNRFLDRCPDGAGETRRGVAMGATLTMSHVHSTLIHIQRRVIDHDKLLLRQHTSDRERHSIIEKLAREESVLSRLVTERMAA